MALLYPPLPSAVHPGDRGYIPGGLPYGFWSMAESCPLCQAAPGTNSSY